MLEVVKLLTDVISLLFIFKSVLATFPTVITSDKEGIETVGGYAEPLIVDKSTLLTVKLDVVSCD